MTKPSAAPQKAGLSAQSVTPYVLIFGDSEDKALTKLVWSLLATSGAEVKNCDNIQDVMDLAPNSLITIICVDDEDQNADLAEIVTKTPEFVGYIFAAARDADTDRRVKLMGCGFDAVFNRHMMESPDFKTILFSKVEKARVRFENRVQQREYQYFRAALTSSPDAFIVFDRDRRIFFVSEHYKRAYPGIANKMVRGLPVMEAFELARVEQGVHESDPRYRPMQKFWETLDGQVEFSIDGKRVWRITAAPLSEGQGTIVTTTDITDLTNQKRAIEEQTLQMSAALQSEQEASLLQKHFIGMISHEFRTPLAVIDGHAQAILRRPEKETMETVQARCKTMRSAVSRLVNMMESILSSNLLKTGRMDPQPEEFDLAELLHELCNEQTELFHPDAIICDTSKMKGEVCLDKKMMTLILSNLLSNAVKFSSEEPKIYVGGQIKGDDIMIEISDNGLGIPLDEQEKIFERYYRASTSAGISGTGIGLNLVQDLVALQNGKVLVESHVGKGSKFTLKLHNME